MRSLVAGQTGRRPGSAGPLLVEVRRAVYHWRLPKECGNCGSRLAIVQESHLEIHCAPRLAGCGWTSYLHPSLRPRIHPVILKKYQREKPRRRSA